MSLPRCGILQHASRQMQTLEATATRCALTPAQVTLQPKQVPCRELLGVGMQVVLLSSPVGEKAWTRIVWLAADCCCCCAGISPRGVAKE